MPDQLTKQSLVNLLIDSPLREPIKINLIDIVNNTTDPDLPKVYPTIVKELEIFQKATERRMKLAEETITKLGGSAPASTEGVGTPPTPVESPMPASPSASLGGPTTPVTTSTAEPALSVPPLDLPPMPTMPTPPSPVESAPSVGAAIPPADVPPTPTPTPMPETPAPSMPSMDASTPLPTPAPLGAATPAPQADEDALAEIQKELDSLKTSAAEDAGTATPAPAATPAPQA